MSEIDAREVKFGFLDSGEDGEHDGVGVVEVSEIYVIHDELSMESCPFGLRIITSYAAGTCWKSING